MLWGIAQFEKPFVMLGYKNRRMAYGGRLKVVESIRSGMLKKP